MDRPITLGELEAALVRSCAPVLLGAKPANLFTFCGRFDESCPDDGSKRSRTRRSHVDAKVLRRRQALERLVTNLDAQLAAQGMRCRIIAWRPFGALVYGYRPALVMRHLGTDSVTRSLRHLGYPLLAAQHRTEPSARAPLDQTAFEPIRDEGQLAPCIDHLIERFREQAVPHEIGYFLGYPVSDVHGFIEHEGRGFLCCGCWKVYADMRGAQYRFDRYKRCTRRAVRLYEAGTPLIELARNPAARVA